MGFELNVQLVESETVRTSLPGQSEGKERSQSDLDVFEQRASAAAKQRLLGEAPSHAHEVKDAKFGHCSIFDIFIEGADDMPFDLPVNKYLKEMLIGMHGAPNKEGEQASTRLRANWRKFKSVLETDAANDVTRTLFGIVLGVVLKRTSEDVVAELRQRLAKSWLVVNLEVDKKAKEAEGQEMETRDWIFGCLPSVLVQCIYRLLIDAFAEDRSQLSHFSDELLEKLTNVVMYEICGFKLLTDTWKQERKQTFQRAVLENPSVNQHDSLQSQKRRERLENSRRTNIPLVFGKHDATPLDGTQLEHVMINRSLARQKGNAEPSKWGSAIVVAESDVPSELSVDRYANLSQIGDALYEKQIQELRPERLPDINAHELRPDSPDGVAESPEERTAEDDNHDMLKNSLEAAKRRETQQAERRKRENMLSTRILDDALPAVLCERGINTAWVSPLFDRLVPCDRDRLPLFKPPHESHKVKMEVPASEILRRSKSEPVMKKSSLKLPKIGARSAELAGAHDTGDNSPGGAHVVIPEKKVARKPRTELTIEPPSSLKNAAVLNRLENHLVQYNLRSFGRHVKEFDIHTGVKRNRMDADALTRAESNYVSSLHDLVGPGSQPALKMYDSPERRAKRRGLRK